MQIGSKCFSANFQYFFFLLKFEYAKLHYFMRNVMHYFEINANGGLRFNTRVQVIPGGIARLSSDEQAAR
jgi:hypothetical protein